MQRFEEIRPTPPVPQFFGPKEGDSPSILKKKKALRFLAYFSIIAVGTGFVALIARASFVKFYPDNCSGAWANAQVVNQNREPEQGGSSPMLDESNSAVLSGGNGQEILCSGFKGENFSGKILSVKLNLIWSFKSLSEIQASETSATGSAVVETASTTENSASTTPAVEPSSTEQDIPAEPSVPAPATEQAPAQPEPSSPAPTPEVSPAPAPAPVPATDTPPSAWFRSLIPVANAEDSGAPIVTATLAFNGLEHFLDVQYSTDGNDWHSIDNAGLEIPLANLEDINKVQIKIVSLREGVELPHVYLYAMWLEAKYIPQEISSPEATSTEVSTSTDTGIPADAIMGDASSTDTAPTSLLDGLTELASNIGDALTEAITPAPAQPEVSEIPPLQAEPPKPAPESEIRFAGTAGEDNSLLATLSKTISPAGGTKITVSSDGKSLDINGNCSSDYYTVLIFADKNDITTDPTRAVMNRANTCAGGHYSFTLSWSDLPQTISEGSYHLILADQKDKNVPEPNAVYEIQINKVIPQ